MDMIEYKGKEYPVVELPNGYCVSTESLENTLIDNGIPVDDEAEHIDNQIWFYVPDEMITKPAEEIQEYVEKEIE